MGPDAHKFYNVEKKYFQCPECNGSEFKNLNTLIKHAEDGPCSMDPLDGPLSDILDAIPVKTMAECLAEEYNPNFDGWNDSDDAEGSDYWYDSDDSDEMDAFYRNPDPWGNGFQGHPHFQEDYDIVFFWKGTDITEYKWVEPLVLVFLYIDLGYNTFQYMH